MHSKQSNCLTVDVEDYFQVSGFEDRVSRKRWDQYDCRVEVNTNRLLQLFDDHHVQATFFVLGWVADRYPELIGRIAAAGHEIASHGYWHQLVYELTPEEFAKDIADSRDAIANACGVHVDAYRAPSFSITPKSYWALDILAEQNFKVDSSIFPIKGQRYGDPNAPRTLHGIETPFGHITEFPPTAGQFGKFPIPIGGGYFRFFPLQMTKMAIGQVNREIGPAMFYLHPWEIDPHQPRIRGAGWKNSFRHYVGLKRTEKRLRQLLRDVPFQPMQSLIDQSVLPPVESTRSPGQASRVPTSFGHLHKRCERSLSDLRPNHQ